jgi:hypothetical protein
MSNITPLDVNVNPLPQTSLIHRGTPTIGEEIAERMRRRAAWQRANAGAVLPKSPGVRKSTDKLTRARAWQPQTENRFPAGRPTFMPPLVPPKPRCTDDPRTGSVVRPFAKALQFRHLQLNGPGYYRWLPFDIDRPGGYYADDDANLPPANVIMVNRANGHAHVAYLLASPVAKHSFARLAPLEYLAAVERGMTNRMGADKAFAGDLIKNPQHPDWLVEWRRVEPYELGELDDALFDHDKRFDPRPAAQWGASRNCTVFNELRPIGYREVLEFKRRGASFEAFRERMETVARGLNLQFRCPLSPADIRSIARSVAKWIWRRFSDEGRSRWAQKKGKKGAAKRWAGHEAESAAKPWEAVGVSRATFYRRKKAAGPDLRAIT